MRTINYFSASKTDVDDVKNVTAMFDTLSLSLMAHYIKSFKYYSKVVNHCDSPHRNVIFLYAHLIYD